MKNVNLNPGGLIGGLGGAGLGSLFFFWNGHAQGRLGKVIVACVVGGAIAGNFLWGLIFPTRDAPPDEPEESPPGSDAP